MFKRLYKKNWIRGWGVCETWKNNMLILLISTQMWHSCDNDTIYDVIIQQPVRKWDHNNRHDIYRELFAELPLCVTYSTISIFKQIDSVNFAVGNPSSFKLF